MKALLRSLYRLFKDLHRDGTKHNWVGTDYHDFCTICGRKDYYADEWRPL